MKKYSVSSSFMVMLDTTVGFGLILFYDQYIFGMMWIILAQLVLMTEKLENLEPLDVSTFDTNPPK